MAIVNINVSITNPPRPSTLLKTGAFVSVGGTTLTAGSSQLLTSKTDLATVLRGAMTVSTITWTANVATVTTDAAHGLPQGSQVEVVISGNTPDGYNGTFTATVTDATKFTYPLAADPGEIETEGTAHLKSIDELVQMNTSFWAQGTARSVYVLELGPLVTAGAVAALSTYIDNDTSAGNTYQTYFAYLVPRSWDGSADFKTLTSLHNANDALVYFFVTTTINTRAAWVALKYKCVFAGVESPNITTATFDMAAPFQSLLANNPGSSNQVPPMAFRFMFGTTVYPIAENGTLLKQLETDNINSISSAAEGGLSNMMLKMGHTLDGMPMNYWYAVAWCIINLELDLANEIINGSNTTTNPLYYDQRGIDRLQRRSLKTLRAGISYGLVIGTGVGTQLPLDQFTENFNNGEYASEAVVNAIPYQRYVSDNESDYQDGKYDGLTGVITPRRGFESITFNLNVTNFVG